MVQVTTDLFVQGHLFHIDFEYILGNDPKPFAPPMKLCEQMVVAMGGRTSKVDREWSRAVLLHDVFFFSSVSVRFFDAGRAGVHQVPAARVSRIPHPP
jgi:hypothetical protein